MKLGKKTNNMSNTLKAYVVCGPCPMAICRCTCTDQENFVKNHQVPYWKEIVNDQY